MSDKTKTFWVGILAPTIPMIIGFGVWLWATGGNTAIAAFASSDLQRRVTVLENNDRARENSAGEMKNDVAVMKNDIGWIKTAMKAKGFEGDK